MEVLLKVEYAVICCVIFMCSISIYIHIILYSQLNEALNNKCSMGGIPLNPTKNALIYLLMYLLYFMVKKVEITNRSDLWTPKPMEKNPGFYAPKYMGCIYSNP